MTGVFYTSMPGALRTAWQQSHGENLSDVRDPRFGAHRPFHIGTSEPQ